VLLEPDDAPYPWNNADPESENYFVEAEQEFVEDWLEQEITAQCQLFSAKLINSGPPLHPLIAQLLKCEYSPVYFALWFAARIPQGWLDRIANIARFLPANSQSQIS